MFHNQIIDAVQNGKKQLVNTFVTDAKFKAELNKLVDAQTQATKNAVDASLAIATAFATNAQNTFKNFVPTYTK